MTDAVVIGAGPNGLVAANVLADRGWDVLVLEAGAEPGGAVKSAEVTSPGFTSDLFSAFYPFAVASPHLARLHLERWGLRWIRPSLAVAHPSPDGTLGAIAATPEATAELLAQDAPGDAERWLCFADRWSRIGPAFVRALLAPFPPVRAGASLLARARGDDLPWLARTALTPARRLGEELFLGEPARRLLAGNALHADLPPEAAGSGLFGWILIGLGQQVGFPVPAGGAGELTAALVRRLRDRGGEVRCGAEVDRIVASDGRARAVVVDEQEIGVSEAVIATVTAPALYRHLLRDVDLPDRLTRALGSWQPSAATVKVDWALDRPVPWSDDRLHQAGTVHLADTVDDLTRYAADLATSTIPTRPFVVFGQMTAADPSRSPAGTESCWAYTHVPQDPAEGPWDDALVHKVVANVEAEVERHAPGFATAVTGRYVQGPRELETHNPNLIGGDLNAGTAQLHQQLVFRPVTGLARAETPVRGVYLGGASAHPGGGVHGAPGANAARAALAHHRLRRLLPDRR